MRSDIAELLSGFENRMRFISIVKAILNNDNVVRNQEIREILPDKDIMDNLVVMVLLFIKERTLYDDKICTLRHIAGFIDDVICEFPIKNNADSYELAKYIVIKVLQNGGNPISYKTYDSSTHKFTAQYIRLIDEYKDGYLLTDDAFDFLFRSKEIESELDYSVTRFRLNEYLKRNNYSQALDQSRELISRVRTMKLNIRDFIIRFHENFSKITVDEYGSILSRVNNLVRTEEKELIEIRERIAKRRKTLEDAHDNGLSEDEIIKYQKTLSEITDNINTTIREQRSLMNMKLDMKEEYSKIIRSRYAIHRFDRMDFDKDIMQAIQKTGADTDVINQLLSVLSKPKIKKHFNIESFLSIPELDNNDENVKGIDITTGEDKNILTAKERNERFERIVKSFFSYASTSKAAFTASAYISSVSDEDLFDYCKENSLGIVLLFLFDAGELDIKSFNDSVSFSREPLGEFEADWFIRLLPEKLRSMSKLKITGQNRSFSFEVEQESEKRKIEMTEMIVEVIR